MYKSSDDIDQDEIRQLMNELWMTKLSLGEKVRLFGEQIDRMIGLVEARAGEGQVAYASGAVLLGLLQTAYRHPEWLMAVCEETKEMFAHDKVSALDEILGLWPIGRMEVEDAGGATG